MADNENFIDNEELLSPVKIENADIEYTPPPRQRKQRFRRIPTHKAHCSKNPSRRLIFSFQDEQDPSPAQQCKKRKRKMKRRKNRQTKKRRFEGRDVEVAGTWVQCTNRDCMKWRYLSDITDPSHVPDVWTCKMNADTSYNSCLLPEQDYSSLEFVHAKFTEGSLVWAKMQGFPWWPAMIEEDPDSELCLYPDPVTGYVTDYHVVFLDKTVTRCWMKVSNIQKYEGGECPGSMRVKGRDYSEKIKAAQELADKAMELPIKERIKAYGFSTRYKGSWGEEVRSQDEKLSKESQHKKKGPKPKLKKLVIDDDEDSSLVGSLLSQSDMDDILDEAEALLGEVQNIVMEVEGEVQQNLLQEVDKDENDSSQKRKAEICQDNEPPVKQNKEDPEMKDRSSTKQNKGGKPSKVKQSTESKMSKELERIQKKKERLEIAERKERERIERREKEKQAKEDQKKRQKQEREEKKQAEKQEEKERKEKEKQEQKEKAKQEKKELKQKEKQAKKELKKKEKAEKKAQKKVLKGTTESGADESGKTEDDAEKAARKEKKRLEKAEKKRLKKEMKKEMKAKKNDEEKKKEASDGKATKAKQETVKKVKPSFQKPKKPTFSAPKQKPTEVAAKVFPAASTPTEESSVSKEIGALINEIVREVSPANTTDLTASTPADVQAPATSPTKPIKKQFKPKFSVKTKDGQKLSETNIPLSNAPSPPPNVDEGLNALDEETSVDIAKILEVNAKQEIKKSAGSEGVEKGAHESDPSAFPLSQMTGNQLELLPKPEHQGDPLDNQSSVDAEDQPPSPVSPPSKSTKMENAIGDMKSLKTSGQSEIQEYSPDQADWSEPDEPQTVPGQKRAIFAAADNGGDSDDSEPFDMEE